MATKNALGGHEWVNFQEIRKINYANWKIPSRPFQRVTICLNRTIYVESTVNQTFRIGQ